MMKAWMFVFSITRYREVQYGAQVLYCDNLDDAINVFEKDHPNVQSYKVKDLTPELNHYGFVFQEKT